MDIINNISNNKNVASWLESILNLSLASTDNSEMFRSLKLFIIIIVTIRIDIVSNTNTNNTNVASWLESILDLSFASTDNFEI